MAGRGRPRADAGGLVDVLIMPQGGSFFTIRVPRGITVEGVIEKAGFDPKTTEARNGDLLIKQDTVINGHTQLVLLPEGKIENGVN